MYGRLTDQQKRIANMLPSGATNKEIAEAVGMHAYSVRWHMTIITRTLGAKNRVEAAVFVDRVLRGEGASS